jgi:hypothetical protein
LRASDPSLVCLTEATETIKLWYNDEHALTLGIRQVKVINLGVTTTTDYALSPMVSHPADHVVSPAVGTTALTGDQQGTDTNTCTGDPNCGRPMWPVLFVTDTTVDVANPRAGDWQFGPATAGDPNRAVPNNPSDVFGTWKGAVRTVNHDAGTVTVTPDADPASNGWNLDGSCPGTNCPDTPPGGFGSLTNQGYGAEVRWSLANLRDRFNQPLVPGHIYRFEFMVHDGDQNKTGGDSGEACANGRIPGNFVPNLTPTATPLPPTATPVPPTATPTPLPQANTSVSVSCDSGSVQVNHPLNCTATVTNTTAGHPNDSPLGTATFTASKPTVTGSPCTLAPATVSTSTCNVTWTPTNTGNLTIKALYTSSNTTKWKSAGNSANFPVTVTP